MKSRYDLLIIAEDSPTSGKPRTSNITIIVMVLDVNEPPVFTTTLCKPSVIDTIPPGTNIINIKANDNDAEFNSVTYELVASAEDTTYFNSYFTLNSKTGSIDLKNVLGIRSEGLSTKSLSFEIVAKDNGNLNATLQCTLQINLGYVEELPHPGQWEKQTR